MAVTFQILIALLASPGQSGAVPTTHSSSLSTELYVSAASAYLSPKHNYTSTFGAGEQAHSRVSAIRSGVATVAAVNTNRSGGGHSVPTPTDTADHTGNAASVNSESVSGQAADSQTARTTTSADTVAAPCPRQTNDCEPCCVKWRLDTSLSTQLHVQRKTGLRLIRQNQQRSKF